MKLNTLLEFKVQPSFETETALYFLITAVNLAFFSQIYEGTDLVNTLRSYSPSDYFVYFCCLLDFVFTFINVLPKYMRFEGAKRHKNEMFVKKSYLTKNYVRLFFHIFFGILSYSFTAYVWFVDGQISSNFKYAVCAIDVGHEITAWLMIRNHDGAMSLRSGNLAFTFLKQIAVAALFNTEDAATIKSLCTFMFSFTSGFAWTRFNCFIIVVLSMFGSGSSFDGLREYWYTAGESSAQMILSYVAGVHGECNLALAFAFFYFPHENWVRTEKYHVRRARAVGVAILAYYLAVPRSYALTHLVVYHALIVYTYLGCGAFFKRDPLPKVDFEEKKSKAEVTPETAAETSAPKVVTFAEPVEKTGEGEKSEVEGEEKTFIDTLEEKTFIDTVEEMKGQRPSYEFQTPTKGSRSSRNSLTDIDDICLTPDFEVDDLFHITDLVGLEFDLGSGRVSLSRTTPVAPVEGDLTEKLSGAGSDDELFTKTSSVNIAEVFTEVAGQIVLDAKKSAEKSGCLAAFGFDTLVGIFNKTSSELLPRTSSIRLMFAKQNGPERMVPDGHKF